MIMMIHLAWVTQKLKKRRKKRKKNNTNNNNNNNNNNNDDDDDDDPFAFKSNNNDSNPFAMDNDDPFSFTQPKTKKTKVKKQNDNSFFDTSNDLDNPFGDTSLLSEPKKAQKENLVDVEKMEKIKQQQSDLRKQSVELTKQLQNLEQSQPPSNLTEEQQIRYLETHTQNIKNLKDSLNSIEEKQMNLMLELSKEENKLSSSGKISRKKNRRKKKKKSNNLFGNQNSTFVNPLDN